MSLENLSKSGKKHKLKQEHSVQSEQKYSSARLSGNELAAKKEIVDVLSNYLIYGKQPKNLKSSMRKICEKMLQGEQANPIFDIGVVTYILLHKLYKS